MAAWPIEELLLRPVLTLLLAVALPGLTRRALLAVLGPRRAEGPFEQAREAAPFARGAALLRALEVPGMAFLGATALAPPVRALPVGPWLALAMALSAALLALASGAAAHRIDVGQADPGTARGRTLLVLRLRALSLAPLLVLLAALPWPHLPPLGLAGLSAAFALAIAYGALPLARLTRAVRAAPPRIAARVEAACRRHRIAAATALVLPTTGAPLANAWAHPLARAVLVTESLAELDDEALDAVLAHEISHVAEPRWVSWLRISGTAVLWTAATVLARMLFVPSSPDTLALVPVACLGVLLAAVARTVAHRMEVRADGHAHEAASKEAFARALLFLQRTNLLPLVGGGSRTHPDLHERLRAAGHDPGPRPAPPGSGAPALLVVAALVLAAVAIERTTRIAPADVASTSAERAWWRLRIVPTDGTAMLALAWDLAARGDVRRARLRVDEAERMGAPPVQLAEARAELLAQEGDCPGAWAAFDESLRLAADAAFADGEVPSLELGGWNLPPSMIEHCAGE